MIKEICEALHAAHQGAEAMMTRARDILYWPRMRDDIERFAKNCIKCAEVKPVNQKETLRVHEVPTQPFPKVGTDCFHKGEAFIVIVDYTTDYIELEKLADQSTEEVIQACKKIFARHGRPMLVHSDNGPQYTSTEFRKFSKEWCFEHTTSSPYTPRSHGKAESAVKIVKKILKTAKDPMRGLMEWRASPNRDFVSPSERLFSRKIRTFIPQDEQQMRPKLVNLDEIKKQRERRQLRMQQGNDKTAKELGELHVGQPVMLKTVNDRVNKWKEATVLEKLSDRSYLVDQGDGIVRRNRHMMSERPVGDERDRGRKKVVEEQVTRRPSEFREDEKENNNKEPEIKKEAKSPVVTRTGCLSRKPRYLDDYETQNKDE